jgi:hypothetical protein
LDVSVIARDRPLRVNVGWVLNRDRSLTRATHRQGSASWTIILGADFEACSCDGHDRVLIPAIDLAVVTDAAPPEIGDFELFYRLSRGETVASAWQDAALARPPYVGPCDTPFPGTTDCVSTAAGALAVTMPMAASAMTQPDADASARWWRRGMRAYRSNRGITPDRCCDQAGQPWRQMSSGGGRTMR